MNRQAAGLSILRVAIGVFFLFEAVGKARWFVTSSILASQFASWSHSAAAGSISHWYLTRIAIPGTAIFARLVPIGELSCGLALIAGAWTRLFGLIAFFMALNFELASGVVFHYSFLTNPYGPPVLGATLALAVGGGRLPLSIRG